MESATVALIIRYFNIALTVILAFFAACGLIIILCKSFAPDVFRGKYDNMFLSAFCVAALFAFAVETVCFNYKHYLKYFADGEFHTTTGLPQDQTTILTSDSVTAKIDAGQYDHGIIVRCSFTNLNRKVTSVFVESTLNNLEQMETGIYWEDEDGARKMIKTLYKAYPYENHTAIQPIGNVSALMIMFMIPTSDKTIDLEIPQIAVNRQIPFYFSGLRLFVVSTLFFAIILFAHKSLRAKTRYYLFEYGFDAANKKQNFVYAGLVILTICFSWCCVYTSVDSTEKYYDRYLVDALMAGRANIDFGNPSKLLDAKYPYNISWLLSNGYKPGVDFVGDVSYYKGKYYVYYGVVPCALLLLPYKLITGKYMSYRTGVFVFASIAVVFLALLWRFSVKKYMPTARFAFYLLSFPALFSVSHLFGPLGQPSVWVIVQIAGFMFAVAGTFLLLKSVDKDSINRLQLFFACLFFALTVGCRPGMGLISILVPAVLWKRRSLKLAMFVLIPYMIVAIPLCAYNYVRFDSIFQFGQKYCVSDGVGLYLLNPLGKIHRMFITFICYCFRPYGYSLHFPFVEFVSPGSLITSAFGFLWIKAGGGGLMNFPILFCLFYLFKNILGKDKPDGFRLSSVFFVVGLTMLLLYSYIGMFHARYMTDCAVFFVLSSLFCAYYWCAYDQSAVRLKVVYGLLAASIFVGMFLFVSGCDTSNLVVRNSSLYRYLELSLGIIRRF